jgi:hypothetical protein
MITASVTGVDWGSERCALLGTRLRASGVMSLERGFSATGGGVFLTGAQIGGTLFCDGAQLSNPDGDAFRADLLDVHGDLFMRSGFRADGRVKLVGARIGGRWDCTGGVFHSSPGQDAIRASNVQVVGNVFFRRGFQATGRVRLFNAQLGALTCRAGTFTGGVQFRSARIAGSAGFYGATLEAGDSPDALDLANAEIAGNLYLNDGFTARGAVRLTSARIGGDVECNQGTFDGNLAAEGMTAGGRLRWQEIGEPRGTVDLRRARVSELSDDDVSWPDPGDLLMDGFSYDRFGDFAPRSPKERVAWIQRQRSYAPGPYQQLAAVYRRNGQIAEAVHVAVAQQEDLRTHGDLGRAARIWNRFLGVTLGHGYRPGRAVWALLGLYIVTLLSVWLGARADAFIQVGNTAPQSSVTASHCGPAYPCFSVPAYTLENITPILDLHQAQNWHPRASTTGGWMLRDWLYLTTVLGYGLTTLLAAGLSGLARSA